MSIDKSIDKLYNEFKKTVSNIEASAKKLEKKNNNMGVHSELLDNNNSNICSITNNTYVPCSVTETFYTLSDNQTKVKCTVTQSSVEETDPQFVSIIWEGELDIEGGRPAGQPVKVTYSYSEDGKMKASFMDGDSGKNIEIDLSINQNSDKSDEPIDIDKFKVE